MTMFAVHRDNPTSLSTCKRSVALPLARRHVVASHLVNPELRIRQGRQGRTQGEQCHPGTKTLPIAHAL